MPHSNSVRSSVEEGACQTQGTAGVNWSGWEGPLEDSTVKGTTIGCQPTRRIGSTIIKTYIKYYSPIHPHICPSIRLSMQQTWSEAPCPTWIPKNQDSVLILKASQLSGRRQSLPHAIFAKMLSELKVREDCVCW